MIRLYISERLYTRMLKEKAKRDVIYKLAEKYKFIIFKIKISKSKS